MIATAPHGMSSGWTHLTWTSCSADDGRPDTSVEGLFLRHSVAIGRQDTSVEGLFLRHSVAIGRQDTSMEGLFLFTEWIYNILYPRKLGSPSLSLGGRATGLLYLFIGEIFLITVLCIPFDVTQKFNMHKVFYFHEVKVFNFHLRYLRFH